MSKRKHMHRKHRLLGTDNKVITSPASAEATACIHKMCYNAEELVSQQLTMQEITHWQAPPAHVAWINVHGVLDIALLQAVAKRFSLHPLVLDDILNTEQRAKLDSYPEYLFLETRLFYYDAESLSVSSEQISMALGREWLLTFQERPSGSFEPVRERLRQGQALLRKSGVDYLCYALLDSLMERYFQVLEAINEDAERLEAHLLDNPSPEDLQNIHRLKHVSIELRRAVWPLREVLNSLIRNEHGFFSPQTVPYLRDLYDHTVHFTESLEAIRDTLSGLMDIYMTSLSQRVNLEVRALTVVAMLFMPATLIAGIFGMNFSKMPWIDDTYGFWWAILIMLTIAIAMLLVFWRRQWLSSRHQQ
ncbi:magnesium/cobalt transporter CorA [Methylophilus aquaticus]|uniref:Magnesium transport protein CorA n=1 Tax=Methylophilus aquaticus TaxID=1971610 RepID=A0ABT9JRC8_9PROT|nr:magnesium/cobalt transporter CorA [Methylophilus aquaticus]MDP8566665.1 magnesium/cobalt transporter CorA [Methylophilus aquaticus]